MDPCVSSGRRKSFSVAKEPCTAIPLTSVMPSSYDWCYASFRPILNYSYLLSATFQCTTRVYRWIKDMEPTITVEAKMAQACTRCAETPQAYQIRASFDRGTPTACELSAPKFHNPIKLELYPMAPDS